MAEVRGMSAGYTQIFMRQYLYFCTSKASKLSTSCLSPFALSPPVATSVRGLQLLVYAALSY
jgi:hypothetical protein